MIKYEQLEKHSMIDRALSLIKKTPYLKMKTYSVKKQMHYMKIALINNYQDRQTITQLISSKNSVQTNKM